MTYRNYMKHHFYDQVSISYDLHFSDDSLL